MKLIEYVQKTGNNTSGPTGLANMSIAASDQNVGVYVMLVGEGVREDDGTSVALDPPVGDNMPMVQLAASASETSSGYSCSIWGIGGVYQSGTHFGRITFPGLPSSGHRTVVMIQFRGVDTENPGGGSASGSTGGGNDVTVASSFLEYNTNNVNYLCCAAYEGAASFSPVDAGNGMVDLFALTSGTEPDDYMTYVLNDSGSTVLNNIGVQDSTSTDGVACFAEINPERFSPKVSISLP